MELSTDRLLLVAADRKSIEAELAGRDVLADQLGAELPDEWPPPLNDQAAFRFVLSKYTSQDCGWWFWHFLLRRKSQKPLAIGIGGFKGPPQNGIVEIGYSVVTEKQRQGYATEACESLVDWAVSSGKVSRVIAHTLVGLTPSIRVLEKLGFQFEGESQDDDAPPGEMVIQYGKSV